jgi:hypothetical protein
MWRPLRPDRNHHALRHPEIESEHFLRMSFLVLLVARPWVVQIESLVLPGYKGISAE